MLTHPKTKRGEVNDLLYSVYYFQKTMISNIGGSFPFKTVQTIKIWVLKSWYVMILSPGLERCKAFHWWGKGLMGG